MKKLIIFLTILAILIAFLYRYGFILALFLFSPPKKKYSEDEKNFIDSLIKVCNCKNIRREPKYDINDGSNSYGFVISGVRSGIDNIDSLKKVSFKILADAYVKVNHKDTSKYKTYFVQFYGVKNGHPYFQFSVNDLIFQNHVINEKK
ncbi:MAG: hypothetical protein MUF45_16860 [Spirosomaceae bacterium]|nr:hypothetical protein [Spirosomataceae bacterium]